MVSKAYDLAERQLDEGTASAAVILQLLKYGSQREKLEQKKLELEGGLLATKRELLESEKRTEALIREALVAMRSYQGIEDADAVPGMTIEHRDGYDDY